jgi:hypothetical protein
MFWDNVIVHQNLKEANAGHITDPLLAYSLSMKMETMCSSETSGSLPAIEHHNRQFHNLHSYWIQNFKSRKYYNILSFCVSTGIEEY